MPPPAQTQPPRSRPGCEDRLLRLFILLLVLLVCACIALFGLVRPDVSSLARLLNRTPAFECGGSPAAVVTPQPRIVNISAPGVTPTVLAMTSITAPQPTSAAIAVAPLPAGGFLELPFSYDGGNVNFAARTSSSAGPPIVRRSVGASTPTLIICTPCISQRSTAPASAAESRAIRLQAGPG